MKNLRRLLMLFGWMLLPAWSGEATVYTAQVVSVIDGDTLWVQPAGLGSKKKLRLLGIDAPEICQAGGRQSRAALKAMVWGQQLQVSEHGSDSYGRGLARLEVDGRDVAAEMVALGQAWSARPVGADRSYSQQEQAARRARLGLFAADKPQWPGAFRKQNGSCYPSRKP